MEVKGLEKLNKTISAQLHPFGISKAEFSGEYAYYYDDESVTYQITENEINDLCFIEFVKERFGLEVEFPFILFLLHEVGHHKTTADLGDSVLDFCWTEKERIDEEIQLTETEEDFKRIEWQYFNLPDEIMATQWAVNYIKTHPATVDKMCRAILKALHNFYEINNITE